MIYRARKGQKLHEIIREAAKLRTPDNVPPVTVVMPWPMGDGNQQMVALDRLKRLA